MIFGGGTRLEECRKSVIKGTGIILEKSGFIWGIGLDKKEGSRGVGERGEGNGCHKGCDRTELWMAWKSLILFVNALKRSGRENRGGESI